MKQLLKGLFVFGISVFLVELVDINIFRESDLLYMTIATGKRWRWCPKSGLEYLVKEILKNKNKNKIEEKKKETNCSIALSQRGSAMAKPLTSFLVFVSKSPFMKDMATWLWLPRLGIFPFSQSPSCSLCGVKCKDGFQTT